MATTTTARVLGPAEGRLGFLGSIGVRFMIDGGETGGGFSLVEHPMSPRALAAPLHRHAREDEYSYVLEGRVGALLGEQVVTGGAGRPDLQAAQPVAHVLERGRRGGTDPRDHLPSRTRALLLRAGRPGRRGASRARDPDDAESALRARDGPRKHPRAGRTVRTAVSRRTDLTHSNLDRTSALPSSVGRAGIEPATLGLRVPCSTS